MAARFCTARALIASRAPARSALLNALFPPPADPTHEIGVITVHTADVDCDHSTGDDGTEPEGLCPGISSLADKIKARPGWKHVQAGLAPLAATFDRVYGSHWGSLRNFVGRGPDHLMMMECHGMKSLIPTALDDAYRAQLYDLYDGWWTELEMSEELALVQMGRFLHTLNGASHPVGCS